ncbi:hypothetical protein [Streptomyces sp. NPDC020742]|uniref:hypothetical protein n=1 Tax=Streptomyces sp. NPDC020742 TaxID=3154897 RepID=UPI0033D4C7AB
MAQVPAQLVDERRGVVRRPVGVHPDQVERSPVDVLPRPGGVGDPAAESLPHQAGDLGEEAVEPFLHRAQRHPPRAVPGGHRPEPVAVGVARDEAGAEGAQFTAGDEHHLGAARPQGLGPLRAVREERPQLLGREIHRERREPHLQPGRRGVLRGDAQPLRIAAGYPYRVAVQPLGDHRHVRADRLGVEDRAGVVVAG